MTSEEATVALAAWAQEILPELLTAYDAVPDAKPEGLPDCVVEVARTGVLPPGDTRFALYQLQQALVYSCEANVSFMVDNADPFAAARLLRSFEDRLIKAALGDPTLGGRVPFSSPQIEFDFTSPLVEYGDGTRGREMTMTIAVGDLVEGTN